MEINIPEYSFENKKILSEFTFDINAGEIVLICGPSGVGKTTLLKTVSGLLGTAPKSDVSFVFSEPRLLPWKTVKQNIEIHGQTVDASQLAAWLTTLGLDDILSLYPSELSTGMAKRVALLRALAFNAPLLLLDEPFSGIHGAVLGQAFSLIREYLEHNNAACLLVSHSLKDTISYADKICMIRNLDELNSINIHQFDIKENIWKKGISIMDLKTHFPFAFHDS